MFLSVQACSETNLSLLVVPMASFRNHKRAASSSACKTKFLYLLVSCFVVLLICGFHGYFVMSLNNVFEIVLLLGVFVIKSTHTVCFPLQVEKGGN